MNPDPRRGTILALLILIALSLAAVCAGVGWQITSGGRLGLALAFGALAVCGSVAAGALVAGWALRGVAGGLAEGRAQLDLLRGDVRERVLPGLEGQKALLPPDPTPLVQAARDEILGAVREQAAALASEAARAEAARREDLAAVREEIGKLVGVVSRRAAAQEELVGALRAALPTLPALQEQARALAAAQEQLSAQVAALRGEVREDVTEALRQILDERPQPGAGTEQEAARLVAAVGEASGQAVKIFTGVARHLDKTWDKVQEGSAGLVAASEESKRIREGVDKALVRLIAQEQRGREVAQQIEEILAGLEAAQEAQAQQAQTLTRFMTLSRAEQGTLSGNLEQLRRMIERMGVPGPRR